MVKATESEQSMKELIASELKKTLENVIKKHTSVSRDDIRKATLDMLNERIEAYKDMLVEMKERELTKAEKTHVCNAPLCTKGISGDKMYCKAHESADPKKNHAKAVKKDETNPGGDGSGNAANIAMSELASEMSKRELCAVCTNIHSGKCKGGMNIKKGALKKEEFIDRNNEAEPGKRLKEAHKPAGVLPGDKKSKVIESDGSGEVTKVKKGELLGEKNGGKLAVKKADVPMAKPPSGGPAGAPKAPSMSKPTAPKPLAAAPKPTAPGMMKNAHPAEAANGQPTNGAGARLADTEKAETPGLFGGKKSGETDGLEPNNEVTDHKAAVPLTTNPAETSPQSSGNRKSAGPISPVFEVGRAKGAATQLMETQRASTASVKPGALGKAAIAPNQNYVAKTAVAPQKDGQRYQAKSATQASVPGQQLGESEVPMEKGDFGMHDNGKPMTTPAPPPSTPGKSAANIRGSKLPGIPLKAPAKVPGLTPPVTKADQCAKCMKSHGGPCE